MMKILLISTNNEKLPMPVAPIGAAYLAGVLCANGYEVDILDLCFEKNSETATLSRLRSFKPDIIGLSLRNLDNSTAFGSKSYIERLKSLTEIIKINTTATIIIGGSGFSSSPKPLLDYLELDYGIIGEGEYSLLKFVQNIEYSISNIQDQVAEDQLPTCHYSQREQENNILSVKSIPGLVYRHNGRIETNLTETFINLDELPQPAWHLIDYKRYLRHGGYGAIQTKRGCEFNCIYCSYPVIEGSRYRLRSPQLVVDEIEQLHKYHKIAHFYFVDSVFTFPEQHARAICEAIIERGLKISWEAMTNPRGLTEELVKLMKQSGCTGVELSIDSASKTMLSQLGKGFSQSDITIAIELYRRFTIPTSVYLLLGGPGESAATVEATVQFLDRLSQPNQVLMNYGIRIYAGTPLAKLAQREGLIASEAELLWPRTYISAKLDDNFFTVLNSYCYHRLHWSNATDWNSPLSGMMMKLAQLLKLRPFWKRAKILGVARTLKITTLASKLYKTKQPTN